MQNSMLLCTPKTTGMNKYVSSVDETVLTFNKELLFISTIKEELHKGTIFV